MPSSAVLACLPSSYEDLGSMEKIQSCDAFPKCEPQRVSSLGILENPLMDMSSNNKTQLFPLLPGEGLNKFGRVSNGIRLFLTNYRLVVLSENGKLNENSFFITPLTSIDLVETRDICCLQLSCKDGRLVKIPCANNETCLQWLKQLSKVAEGASKRETIFSFGFHAWCKEGKRHLGLGFKTMDVYVPPIITTDPEALAPRKAMVSWEFKRLQLDNTIWRVSGRNEGYKLCDSYPEYWITPAWITDVELEKSAGYRFLNRIPALVWRDRRKGSILLRSSQPCVGVFGWRCTDDEQLLNAYATAAVRQPGTSGSNGNEAKPLIILDARSYSSAFANRAKGGGFESPEYYQNCQLHFMGLANIHGIRNSFNQLRLLLALESSDSNTWLQCLQNTQWMQNISSLLKTAVQVCETLNEPGRTVLVHCSDGWDRTAQIVSLVKLLLDSYYRTMIGFRELIERDWIEFGHKFSDRCGVLNQNSSERSPVFLQWLDCVHQLIHQYPKAFQFNHSYLIKLAQHCYSGLFGTFLCNSAEEAAKERLGHRTFSVWTYLHPDNSRFQNAIYEVKEESILWPSSQIRDLRLWMEVYGSRFRSSNRSRDQMDGNGQSDRSMMDKSLTRARSCEGLNSITTIPKQDNAKSENKGIQEGLARSGSEKNLHVSGTVEICAGNPDVKFNVNGEGNNVSFAVGTPANGPSDCGSATAGTPGNGQSDGGSATAAALAEAQESASLWGDHATPVPNLKPTDQLSSDVTLTNLLDSDGLMAVRDPVQDKFRQIQRQYKKTCDALERENQRLRAILHRKQSVSSCSNKTNSPADKLEAYGERQRVPSSNDSANSDFSWDAVNEDDAEPTRWVPDHAATRCMGCDTQFWAINRRHHCRSCGKVFCNECSKFESPVPTEQFYQPVRVCNSCYNALRPPQTVSPSGASC